ncbi:Uncharacterized protein conserved in bacteria [Sphingobacterium spiritivorum]|uniref:Uncharacterized protein conserved in bacteria n=2 Tax=Sphingobacterium spiritivorum TaxID=258 RepID=A0A380CPK1_SPHSI|nr:Uncharacterized protein conserved in bacteria [Sphingobacterium spiritivorum]
MYLKFNLLILLFLCYSLQCQAQNSNMALHMDGKDNDVRTGIGIMSGEWTIEAWIKGNDSNWKPYEAIIGGGEYSELNICDNMPLVLRDGYLHNKGAQLTASVKMDDNWHHVAASCNGRTTVLYMDGKEVGRKDTAIAILPGAIGLHEKEHCFGGLIDEVRIWSKAIPVSAINEWKNKSVVAAHPYFSSLTAYYNFDDFRDVMSVNWVGKGPLAYHLRNGRSDYYGHLPMAYAVDNTNTSFENFEGKQQLFNAVVIQNEWDLEQGTKDGQALKIRVIAQGNKQALTLDEIRLRLNEQATVADIRNIRIYYTGQYPRSSVREPLFEQPVKPAAEMVFREKRNSKKFHLRPGVNYFLVTFDIAEDARVGHKIQATVPDFKLSGKTYIPEEEASEIGQHITPKMNNNLIRVLQWNIWHGGVHLGKEAGRSRITDLIRSAKADIITMQEGYSAQDSIAQALGFHLQTKSSKDNLALLSRYPIESIKSSEPFKSNPAKIDLPNGKRILVNDCWLRYAYRPEYTCAYQNTGMNPQTWIAEDTELALTDIRNLMEKDVNPYIESPDMPVIIAGDFNSCSHLDWTERTRSLHYGYGPVAFPTSKFMYEQGFKDSFRELNPDELTHQGGTFAPIYGQLQNARIDFIYYKGGIKAISSKIVRTSPDIDDVWASDHAAVLTIFTVE